MKKEEKQILFNLLKTADSYVNGYQRDCFNVEVEFQDDENDNEEIVQKVKTEDSSEIEVTKLSETSQSENHDTSGDIQAEVTKFSESLNKEKNNISPEHHLEQAKLSETSPSENSHLSGENQPGVKKISQNLNNEDNNFSSELHSEHSKLTETQKSENHTTSSDVQAEVTKFSESLNKEKNNISPEHHLEQAKLSETFTSLQNVSTEKLQEVSEISENLKNVENAAQNMFANADKVASDAATEVEELKNKDFSPVLSSKSTEEKQPEHNWPVYEGNVLGQAPDITANIPDEKNISSRISFSMEESKQNIQPSQDYDTKSLADLAMKTQQNGQNGTENIQNKTEKVPEESYDRISFENASSQKSGITLDQLNQKILRCTRCGLARTRNNVVPGEGVLNPDVLVVGEGPGYDEDMQGHPFVGKAGMLLDKMLHAIYLDRHTNCFIGNIVKCRPPQNRNPFPDEQDACFPFLEAQIHILKPKMILCLGKVAIEKIMNQKISITACHGQFFDYNGIPVMATYHPSALLRNQELKRPAWEDLKGFARKLDEIKRKK